MDFKKFWKESTFAFILKRILVAIVIVVALVTVTLYAINIYTHHGESETVPDVRGLFINEAELMFRNHGLFPQIIDSVFRSDKKLGTIIEQIPGPNSKVKKNRPIYLIINAKQVKQIPVPDLADVSYRQALAMIKAIGLQVDKVEYKPSEYKDLVIDVKYRGVSIAQGMRIPIDSYLTLVVGNGLGLGNSMTPMLKGMSLEDAKLILLNDSLITGALIYDVEPMGDETEYVIYRQRPGAGKSVSTGSRIDLWLSKDRSLLDKVFEEEKEEITNESEDEFF